MKNLIAHFTNITKNVSESRPILQGIQYNKNAELEKENYNLNQQMIELRFHQRMISETQEIAKNQK